MELIDEKIVCQKISWNCPFKGKGKAENMLLGHDRCNGPSSKWRVLLRRSEGIRMTTPHEKNMGIENIIQTMFFRF
jgi:hypothetical protein